MIKVLIACEESQEVCKAFRTLGHEAYSCDLLDCSGGHPEWHIQGDAIAEAYSGKYDMMIAHPPCTYLSYAGTKHWNNKGRLQKRLKALRFFAKLWLAPIEYICLENPKGCASPTIAKYAQEIQPYYFGDREYKTTWLWLKNLPQLEHYEINSLFNSATHTAKPEPKAFNKNGKAIHWCDSHTPGADRGKLRSKTFPGIAQAMASQWGELLKAKQVA
jgi:site-specific DNA-cytosine methylase